MEFIKLFKLCLLNVIISVANSLEKEVTVNVDAGKQDCYYQNVSVGQVIDIEYQVIDGGHGDLDISFHLIDPTGRIIGADFKKSENSHRVEALLTGDYRFCFDNTFSTFNSKTVFFELIVEKDGVEENEWSDENNFELQPEGVYELTVAEISESVLKVRNHISKVRQIQDIIKSTEARDRNIAEENYFKVNTFSAFQIGVMLTVMFVQVIMVRSLFDDRSKVHKLWKNLDYQR